MMERPEPTAAEERAAVIGLIVALATGFEANADKADRDGDREISRLSCLICGSFFGLAEQVRAGDHWKLRQCHPQ